MDKFPYNLPKWMDWEIVGDQVLVYDESPYYPGCLVWAIFSLDGEYLGIGRPLATNMGE